MDRRPRISAVVLATLLAAGAAVAVGPAPNGAASPAATGDFSGRVDIGGRSLYLECRGQGSPTVILEAGAGGRADVWSQDLEKPPGTRTMVLPGVAASPHSSAASKATRFPEEVTLLPDREASVVLPISFTVTAPEAATPWEAPMAAATARM